MGTAPELIYKLNISYDGTDFQGFQAQQDVRTVQDTLEEALRRIGWTGTRITASGRTDSGVHARGQVIAFEMAWKHGTESLLRALNANLPPDVAAWRAEAAEPGFHPRFDAVERWYSYRILCSPVRKPMQERYVWRIWPEPDLGLMQQAADVLLGVHDFGAFGRAPIPGGHTTRQVFAAAWRRDGPELELNIAANAFLYHMVRRMTAAMVEAGWARMTAEEIRNLLDCPGARWEGSLAPASGLCLEKVCYQERMSAGC